MKVRFTMSETFQDILKRMKAGLPDGASAIEGTFTGNNLLAVADELARMYSQDIDTLLPRVFAVTASGDDLDRAGGDIGIGRKKATCAEAIVTVSGEAGSYGGILLGADHVLFLTDTFVIGESGTADVRAVCQSSGTGGNVPAGSINAVRTAGVTLSVVNRDMAYGGYDDETDEDYRARILDKKRNIITGGTRENYRQGALSVPGVDRVKVIDLFKGPGTVGIYIIASDNAVAGAELLDKVHNYIESVRPCGPKVEILSAEPLQIDMNISAVLSAGIGVSDCRNVFMQTLHGYMGGIPFRYGKKTVVSYLRVADLLLQTEGVEDVTDVLINNSRESIYLEERQFPVIGTVTLEAAG